MDQMKWAANLPQGTPRLYRHDSIKNQQAVRKHTGNDVAKEGSLRVRGLPFLTLLSKLFGAAVPDRKLQGNLKKHGP